MKFLCDQMLGTLAKWLRIYGFDTFYANSTISDDELLKISKKEERCLITRDKELVFRCRRENMKVIQLETINLDEQLKIVLKDLKIDKDKILSRCIICNSELSEIKKNKLKIKFPKKYFKIMKNFVFVKNAIESIGRVAITIK